ncbi:MAG TPA: hypothetical protein VKB18_04880 [Gemmatimonadota bacterium]|nr:hypothetical protein [Gemmatimonadota bacterium]
MARADADVRDDLTMPRTDIGRDPAVNRDRPIGVWIARPIAFRVKR